MDATANHSSAADRVYGHVRMSILSRRFADNDLLSEGRIATEVAVSRTPVREALLRLEAEGMVRLLPKRGALVLPISAQEWRDVLATRELVETHCIRNVIENGRAPMVSARLARSLEDLRQAAEAGDVTAYVTADRDFHATIVAAAGNSILNRLYGSLRDRQLRMGTANLLADDAAVDRTDRERTDRERTDRERTDRAGSVDHERMDRTLADHRAIADAICAQDVGAAVLCTTEHLATAANALA
jgi:DNA-binding GntR family transcriptional regulator